MHTVTVDSPHFKWAWAWSVSVWSVITQCTSTKYMQALVRTYARWYAHTTLIRSEVKSTVVFSLIVFWATLAENVWPPCSKSVRSLVSTALRTVTFMRAWIYTWRYMGFSPASKGSAMLSQSKHWSGGCWVCRTCSAAPVIWYGTLVPPYGRLPLLFTNSTVEDGFLQQWSWSAASPWGTQSHCWG